MAKIFLNVFDRTYEIIGFKHSMFRFYDPNNYCYPKSGLLGGFFEVEFASDADVSFLEKMVMIEWGERNFEKLSDDDYVRMNCFSGKLSCQFDETASGKVYEWEYAIVAYYEEIMHSFTGEPMKTRVVFSPFDLRVNNLLISRYSGNAEKGTWYFYEPEEVNKQVVDSTPEVIDYYLSDKNNNFIRERLENYVGEKLILNIRTRNLIGEKITFNLNYKEVDFEYEGKRLQDDVLTNYEITKDFEQIELKVVKPKILKI